MNLKTMFWPLLAALILPLAVWASPAESPFSITRSSETSLQLHFDLPSWTLENTDREGESLQKVKVEGTPYLFIEEQETLPVFSATLAIPYSGGASLSVINSASQALGQYDLDFSASLNGERLAGRFAEARYPANPAVISEPQVIRDFRVVTVNLYPFQYDPDTRQLTVRESFDLRIDFTGGPGVNEIAPPQSYSQAFDKIYRGLILNYDQALDREISYTSPRILVIYGNYSDATYLAKVNEYVTWKRQKGFLVTAVSTNVAGTNYTAIKTYIQNQYNNLATRPDYITIIGDDSGTIGVPTYYTYMDYYYTWLAGSDNLGDVIIGRISADTASEMVDYMGKIRSLEKNVDLGTAAWLDRMVLVGDTASSGISTIYTNEYIHDHSLAVNPDYTYTELYTSGPSSTTINAAINHGVAFYNYRGYIGMSGWPSSMSSMNNAWRLFHAVFITCSTGTWGGSTSTTESVVRYGSEASLGGAVTAIGMATSSTHTPMNNCLDVGIFHGLYPLGLRDMGAAMLYGKLYLNAIYGVSNSTQAYNFAGFCNLIGDPTAEVFVGIPTSFHVTAPASIPAGSSNLEVIVKDNANQPVEGASVALTNSAGAQYLAFSGVDGKAFLTFSDALADSLTLTVNKHDFKPDVKSILIEDFGGAVYAGQTVDDSESGNSDGLPNAGETVELYVTVRNTTSAPLSLSGTVTTSDPQATLIEWENIPYTAIAAGGTAQNSIPIVVEIAPNCPDQHQILLSLELESNDNRWVVQVPLTVASGDLELQSYTFVGAAGNVINPGDQYPFTLSLTNAGNADLAGISARLRSHDMFLAVSDSLGYFGNLNHGITASNTADTFTLLARSTAIEGMTVPMSLYLYNSQGFEQTVPFTLTVGQTSITDPLGQDAYGYFIFDDGDIGYDQCPTYQWIGIAPAEGGSGTALSLSDPGSSYDEGDQVGAVAIQTVNLPFSFKYYGVDYTRASISSNGFIAFGETADADWRNWRMPDAGGPSPMIAAFWDDLDLVSGTSNVYTYYNSSLHYYVVEWYHLVSGYDGATQQTFQAILYDPVFYPTHTGDGQIKLQYKDFNNIDLGDGDSYPHGNYCTIGIEDHTETVGLEYTFGNSYPTAAAPLADESALFITTRPLMPDYPYVAIEQVQILDSNVNQHLEPGEAAGLSIRLGNRGLVGATGVSATLSTTDPYVTVTAAEAYYGDIAAQGNAYPQTNYAVSVAANCPADHQIAFTLAISSDTGNWSYNFPLSVYVPELAFSDLEVHDLSGNQNGILDPGESATLTIRLNNTGEIPSPAGTATLACSTPGISVTTASDTFPSLITGDYEILSFGISASAAMTNGTLVALHFNATAGTTTASAVENLEVGAPLVIVIGNGTSTQGYPLDRWYNYSAHEAIYLASEIATAGTLKSLAFYKDSGSDQNPIQAVTIYMKHTPATSIESGNYSTAGYTQVYSGAWPNNAASGWMEVDLNPMFVYDGVSNLSVLTVKGYEQYISNYPYWTYTSVSPSRARQNRSDSAAPTNLMATANLPNLRLKVFPEVDLLMPPQDLAASASHQSVLLTWSAPPAGTPTGYKIYRNNTSLATVASLSYTDLAVTNGTTYNYHLIAVYAGGESSASQTVTATPNAIAPTNLSAVGGNGVVNLSWTGASGREELTLAGAKDRAISSYRVYRDGTPLTTVTATTYEDTAVSNGTTYSYHVTTVYASPAGESGPSNTATATPNIIEFVILGSGTTTTNAGQNSPINISNNSNHGQSVYTAAELNAAGVTGPVLITGLGFNVVSAPIYSLVDFVVRMKHTTATDASVWQNADGLVTTYSNPSYLPTAGGYDLLPFTTPFEWNGTDNLVIDTAFGLMPEIVDSGTLQYTALTNGYRFAYSDVADQTNVFSDGMAVPRRYNVRLALQSVPTGPAISVNPSSLNYGPVVVGTVSALPFTIANTGDQDLTGSITTPAGFSVASRQADTAVQRSASASARTERNTLAYSIPAGSAQTFSLSFAPTAVRAYSGNVTIVSNDPVNPSVILPVSGSGYLPPAISLDANTLSVELSFAETGSDSFTISNSGSQPLTFTLAESPAVTWFSVLPVSGSVAGGGSQPVTASFSAVGCPPGTYHSTLLVNSNAPDTPQLQVAVEMVVLNTAPTIELPASFSFDMNGNLAVDFDPYVNDTDNQALLIEYSGNSNVSVAVNGLTVTFSAAPGWHGSEDITFSVYDGIVHAYDTVTVTVVLTELAVPQISSIAHTGGGAVIQWNAVTGAQEYLIFRSNDPYSGFVQIGTSTLPSYTDAADLPQAFYRVQAVSN